MNIIYNQANHTIKDEEGNILVPPEHCWSGRGQGKNAPEYEDVKDTGCLPDGVYSIGKWGTYPPLGPYSVPLTQMVGNKYNRSGFYIHGPDVKNYGQESRGCIIVTREYRLKLMALNPDILIVE